MKRERVDKRARERKISLSSMQGGACKDFLCSSAYWSTPAPDLPAWRWWVWQRGRVRWGDEYFEKAKNRPLDKIGLMRRSSRGERQILTDSISRFTEKSFNTLPISHSIRYNRSLIETKTRAP